MVNNLQNNSQMNFPETKAISIYANLLKKYGYSKKEIEESIAELINKANRKTMGKVLMMLSADELEKWKKFKQTANVAQQLIMFDYLCKKHLKKTLEQLQDENIIEAVNIAILQLRNAKDLAKKVAPLSEQELNHVIELLNKGRYSEVENLLDDFSKK